MDLLTPKELIKAAKLLRLNMFGKSTGPDEFTIKRKDGSFRYVEINTQLINPGGKRVVIGMVQDISERKHKEIERKELIRELQAALNKISKLSGLLAICANCKKIRDDKGYWADVEDYIKGHSEADFSHSLCPDFYRTLYPGLNIKESENNNKK